MFAIEVTALVPPATPYQAILDAWVGAARSRGLRAFRDSYPIDALQGGAGEWNCGMVHVDGNDYVLYVPLEEAADPANDWIVRARPAQLQDHILYHYVRPCVEVLFELDSPLMSSEVARLTTMLNVLFDAIAVFRLDWPKLEIIQLRTRAIIRIGLSERLVSAPRLRLKVEHVIEQTVTQRLRPFWPHLRFALRVWASQGSWPPRQVRLIASSPYLSGTKTGSHPEGRFSIVVENI